MDRLYKNVWEKVNDGSTFQKALFIFAYSYKKKQMLNGFQTRMLDKYVTCVEGFNSSVHPSVCPSVRLRHGVNSIPELELII